MTVRALMVDVDGVVIRHPDGLRWDHSIEVDLGVSPGDLQERFFKPHFAEIIAGKADLHDRLGPVLASIAPHLTSHRLTEYWFAQDSHLDQALLDDLAVLRATGLELHLATVQEHHRACYLWETLGLRDRFEAIHYAADYGVGKPDPDFFRAVETRTGFAPADLLLLDDSPRNVESARACGWDAVLWDGTRRLGDLLADRA